MNISHPRVIGLDLSLTSTGVSDGQSAHAIQTSPDDPLEARLDRVVRGVVSFALSPASADLAVIEAGAFSRGAQSEAAEILSALRLMVRHRLWRLGIPYAMVAPSTLKLATTGYGKASKQMMVISVDERHHTDFKTVKAKDGRYDMTDAHALAAMGYHHIGRPLKHHAPAPPLNHQAMHAVKWPDLMSDD